MALDLARVTGVAYGPIDWAAPLFECWHMPLMGGEGARFGAFENELIDKLDVWEPGHIVVESPIPLPAATNRQAVYQQLGMRAILHCNAWRRSISISEISAEIVRSEVLGFSRVSGKPGAIKEHVFKWCRRQGWRVPDHNAGDACMIWEWHRRRLAGPRQSKLWERVNERADASAPRSSRVSDDDGRRIAGLG